MTLPRRRLHRLPAGSLPARKRCPPPARRAPPNPPEAPPPPPKLPPPPLNSAPAERATLANDPTPVPMIAPPVSACFHVRRSAAESCWARSRVHPNANKYSMPPANRPTMATIVAKDPSPPITDPTKKPTTNPDTMATPPPRTAKSALRHPVSVKMATAPRPPANALATAMRSTRNIENAMNSRKESTPSPDPVLTDTRWPASCWPGGRELEATESGSDGAARCAAESGAACAVDVD